MLLTIKSKNYDFQLTSLYRQEYDPAICFGVDSIAQSVKFVINLKEDIEVGTFKVLTLGREDLEQACGGHVKRSEELCTMVELSISFTLPL